MTTASVFINYVFRFLRSFCWRSNQLDNILLSLSLPTLWCTRTYWRRSSESGNRSYLIRRTFSRKYLRQNTCNFVSSKELIAWCGSIFELENILKVNECLQCSLIMIYSDQLILRSSQSVAEAQIAVKLLNKHCTLN